MFNKSQSSTGQNKGQSTVESSLHGLAKMLALIAAFLACPQIYAFSADPVYAYLLDSYGDEFIAGIGVYVWTGISTAAVYYFCKVFFVLSLMVIGQRLIMFAF